MESKCSKHNNSQSSKTIGKCKIKLKEYFKRNMFSLASYLFYRRRYWKLIQDKHHICQIFFDCIQTWCTLIAILLYTLVAQSEWWSPGELELVKPFTRKGWPKNWKVFILVLSELIKQWCPFHSMRGRSTLTALCQSFYKIHCILGKLNLDCFTLICLMRLDFPPLRYIHFAKPFYGCKLRKLGGQQITIITKFF